ncbi:hypothetical protein BDR26DRAFT_1003212 [Obelidium mucronatum]|nr:hypothetical protein BDR26DRAFT_1003212 [Obelidium mucronatum]
MDIESGDFAASAAVAALTKGLAGAHADRQRSVLEAAAALLGAANLHAAQLAAANHALLVLADVWRESDNSLRIAIYKVFKLVSASLAAPRNNISGIIKRIKVVLISNDPIARALTLRLYGLLAHTIHDNIDVHHSIIESLESTDPLEYNAAIFATDRSAKTSMFLMEIVQKISRISTKQGPATSTNLIRILSHVHRNLLASQEARALCLRLINHNPPIETKLVIFRSLTILALHVPFQIPMQIQFLSSYLIPESSELIILSCLDNLNSIAESASHHFKSPDLKRFSAVITNQHFSTALKTTKAIRLLQTLCKSSRFAELLFTPATDTFISPVHIFNSIVKADNGALVASKFFKLSLEFSPDERRKAEALERIYEMLLARRDCKNHDVAIVTQEISVLLHCFIIIACTGSVDERLGDRILFLLESQRFVPFIIKEMSFLCKELMKNRLKFFGRRFAERVLSLSAIDCKSKLQLLKQCLRFPSDVSFDQEVLAHPGFQVLLESNWDVYQVAQSAMIGGHVELANILFEQCQQSTQSEPTQQWLQVLHSITLAECELKTWNRHQQHGMESKFQEAVSCHYHKAQLLLTGLTPERRFCQYWISLRIMYLRAMSGQSSVLFRPLMQQVITQATKLKKMFPDMDGQSRMVIGDFIETCTSIMESGIDNNGGDVVMTTITDDVGKEDSVAGGGISFMFPSYFFVTKRICLIDAKISPAIPEDCEIVAERTDGARIVFTVEGDLVVDAAFKERLSMHYHQVSLTIHPQTYWNGSTTSTESSLVSSFKSRIKDGYFETKCSIGYTEVEAARWNLLSGIKEGSCNEVAGKYVLLISNQLVDAAGEIWDVGPVTSVVLTIV